MKLSLSYQDLAAVFSISLPLSDRIIETVSFDTRKINNGSNSLFFALKGNFRDGHDFVHEAYKKNVRTFVVTDALPFKQLDAIFIEVEDPLKALQLLAKNHREKFDYPIIGITGSAGKTIAKEWLNEILSGTFKVIRSPKSYNSQLGVALSLLELNEDADLAIIEAGISKPDEMDLLEDMIQPTLGIFTSIGTSHSQNFDSIEEKILEKLKLFKNTEHVFMHSLIPFSMNDERFQIIKTSDYSEFIQHMSFGDETSSINASLIVACAQKLGVSDPQIKKQLETIERIALRLETFEGINNCTIINDTYNLDIDAFRSSLEYQLSIAKGRNRAVVIGGNTENDELTKLLKEFEPIEVHFSNAEKNELTNFQNSVVLVKGKRSMQMERYAMRLRLKKHQTFVEIDLNAIKHNISYFKQQLPEDVKILTMVKASSYGAGIEKIGQFLERIGVDYLGVAYTDEGIELRKSGVTIPILVMNTENEGFEDCIQYQLEPCIYSSQQLDNFIRQLIYSGISLYPIHIKIETGMNRLGFNNKELPALIETLKSQPEVRIKSIYSHLADSDNIHSSFVLEQVERFQSAISYIKKYMNYSFDCHILNSEGVLNHSKHHFDMVRLGIGMYGYTKTEEHKSYLNYAIKWFSSISQIKSIKAGETIGYGRSGRAKKSLNVGVVPVGYADGFRRSLGNGKGGVYISGVFCPVIGNVCMDMVMIDIGNLDIQRGHPVEILGEFQSLDQLARVMETIPYEVLTGISRRVHRVYIDE